MTTFADLINRVLRVLADPDQAVYTDELIYDALLGAQSAIVTWVPKQGCTDITSGSDGVYFLLPSDCYQVQAVQLIDTLEFFPHSTLTPGTVRGTTYTANDWIEYPYGYISLGTQVPEGSIVRVFYLAYWRTPASESDQSFVMEIPINAMQGLIYYMASHCLMPEAKGTAGVRQYGQRVDSGNPEDNPLQRTSDWFYKRFLDEMKRMPLLVKPIS